MRSAQQQSPSLERTATPGAMSSIALAAAMSLLTVAAHAGDVALDVLLSLEPADLALADRLGLPICTTRDGAKATSTSYYRSVDGATLALTVDDATWAVDYGRVIRLSVDHKAALPDSCAHPRHAALPTVSYSLFANQTQLQLGDAMDRAIGVLGEPDAVDRQAAGTHVYYTRDRDYSHVEQWMLTFQNGRLQGWRILSHPVFYEVAG